MCGRFDMIAPYERVRQRFQLQSVDIVLPPRYNIAPTTTINIIKLEDGEKFLDLARWGLIPSWTKDISKLNLLINARAEGITETNSFRGPFKRKRVLIPATGFYEWPKINGKKIKGQLPVRAHLPGNEPFAFAGVCDHWTNPEGNVIQSCAIITTSANSAMEPIHDRMPVIVEPDNEDDWLNATEDEVPFLLQMLKPYAAEHMVLDRVGSAVNTVANDTAVCIEPLIDDTPLTLF